jgi:hypothetical protein
MLLYIIFIKNVLSLLFSSHLCLVTRENRDKGTLNMPLTPELKPVNSILLLLCFVFVEMSQGNVFLSFFIILCVFANHYIPY